MDLPEPIRKLYLGYNDPINTVIPVDNVFTANIWISYIYSETAKLPVTFNDDIALTQTFSIDEFLEETNWGHKLDLGLWFGETCFPQGDNEMFVKYADSLRFRDQIIPLDRVVKNEILRVVFLLEV